MSGYDVLHPLNPAAGSLDARIRAAQDTVRALEERPVPSIGAGAARYTLPVGQTPYPGARHFNTNTKQMEIYDGEQWIASGYPRVEALGVGPYSLDVTVHAQDTWIDLGGPEVTLPIPDRADSIMMVHLQGEIRNSNFGSTILEQGYVGIEPHENVTTKYNVLGNTVADDAQYYGFVSRPKGVLNPIGLGGPTPAGGVLFFNVDGVSDNISIKCWYAWNARTVTTNNTRAANSPILFQNIRLWAAAI